MNASFCTNFTSKPPDITLPTIPPVTVHNPMSPVMEGAGQSIPTLFIFSSTSPAILLGVIMRTTGARPQQAILLDLKFHSHTQAQRILLLSLVKGRLLGVVSSLIRDARSRGQAFPPKPMPSVVNYYSTNDAVCFRLLYEEIAFENREEYLAKVAKRVANYEVKIMNPPREGKRCLVLDIDYTLFDHRSVAECANELMRPFLHEFLATAYEYYDIIIWSATSMKWIVEKMRLLGVLDNPAYKIMFFLDSGAMVSVHSEKYGVIDVKPLGVIWGKYPQYGPHNTVIIDDLRRNFLLNPKNGLKIKAFRKSHLNRDKDRELVHLASYLVKIATLNDFSVLEHSEWYEYIQSEKTKR
nr:EOG090X0A5K [Artemia franciscana]